MYSLLKTVTMTIYKYLTLLASHLLRLFRHPRSHANYSVFRGVMNWQLALAHRALAQSQFAIAERDEMGSDSTTDTQSRLSAAPVTQGNV